MKNQFKKLIFILFVALFSTEIYAQVPQGFNFQAVARGTDGLPLIEQELGVQVTILDAAGSAVYTETHTDTTNAVGLLSLVIGEGAPSEGNNFSGINWASGDYHVKLAIDPTGGTSYEELGTTRLLSVPYALLAQNVVNGTSVDTTGNSGFDDFIEIDPSDASLQDSLTIVRYGNETPEEFAYGVTIVGASTGRNRPLAAKILEEPENAASQYAISGTASGLGSGTHIGMLGTAWSPDATGGNRYGVYGQAASQAKYNYGVNGVAYGAGNGDEGEGYGVGSINFGLYGYAEGNSWNNTGVEGSSSGENGKWSYGVHGLSSAGAVDSAKNHGVAGRAFGPGINYGVYGSAWDGVENWAGWFDGDVNVNGNLMVNGAPIGGGEGGSANGSTLDSLFFQRGDIPERKTIFYPGYQRYEDENGNFSLVTRTAFQYGNNADAGIYNWYSKGGAQVAHADYPNGERATGMNPGYFYMDIYKDENFYAPFEMGIGNAADGGRPWLSMSSLALKENGGGSLVDISVSNDTGGEAGYMMLRGDASPNIQMGGQNWTDGNMPYIQLFGTTEDGNGWYHSNAFFGTGSDGTDEWASLNLNKTNIAGQTTEETILLDGLGGNITATGTVTATSVTETSDRRLKTNIQPLKNALDNTLQLRGVSYNWMDESKSRDNQIGVIAQEVEEIYPEFVHTDEEGMKSVNYSQMVAVLIEAVKDLNAKIEALENENSDLKTQVSEIDAMKSQLNTIMKMLQVDTAETKTAVTEE